MTATEPKYMARVNRLKKKVFETYPEIDLEDAGAVVHVELHARRRHQIVQRQFRVGLQLRIVGG